MEKAVVAFCKLKKVLQNCFMDLKMLNEKFRKTPCNFLNEKEVDAYRHCGDATIEISPFNWESVSSGLSTDVAINEKFELFVNAFDNKLQIRDKIKILRLVLHNKVAVLCTFY